MLFSLAGFGLRVQRLGFQPLWGDEGWSFYFASLPLPELIARTAVDIHPPLYYLLLKGWLSLSGFGPETARFLSVAAGTLLIPAVGVLGRRLFDGRVGAASAGVTAVMPLALYYSHEVRMYGLVTLLGAVSLYAFLRLEPDSARPKFAWLHLAATTAALYTIYYAAFIWLAEAAYLLLRRRNGQRWRLLVGAGLLYMPWLLYAAPRLTAYVLNKRAVEQYIPLNIIRFVGDHLIAFSLGHLPPELQPYVWAAFPFLLAAGLGLVAARRRPILYLYLGLPLAVGYAINRLFPFTPPYYERTLLLAAPAYWLLIGLGVIWLWDHQYLLVGTVVIAMSVAAAVSLAAFYTQPRYTEADYRPLLRQVAARSAPEDTLLASYQWQLGFYYAYLPRPYPHFFTVPGWGRGWTDPARMKADLAGILARSPRLWFPAHQALGHLWEDEAEAMLAGLGYPTWLRWHGPQTKLILTGAGADDLQDGPTANFADLLFLFKSRVGGGQYEAGRGIVPVELRWQKRGHLGSAHRVSLRLADEQGRAWAVRDSFPVAGRAFFTDMAVGETLSDRHGLLVEAGTPPGQYRLLLSLRRAEDAHPLDLVDETGQPLGVELELGRVTVIEPDPPVGTAALPAAERLEGAVFGGTVRLVGYSLPGGPFKAGEELPLTLFWQSLADRPALERVSIHLRQGSETAVRAESPPIWAASAWRQGTLLRDPHAVRLPPDLPPGRYELLAGPDGDLATLTHLTTIDRPRSFQPPAPQIPLKVNFGDKAELVGVDLPRRELQAGERLSLTLYWQATGRFEKSRTVFVHALDEAGRIAAQEDRLPGGGQFPTTGWLPGEYLTDTYQILLPAAGEYRLAIGLYDANDFSRLPVLAGGEPVSDHILLEEWPIIVRE